MNQSSLSTLEIDPDTRQALNNLKKHRLNDFENCTNMKRMRMEMSSICSPTEDVLQVTHNENTIYVNKNSTLVPKDLMDDIECQREQSIEKEVTKKGKAKKNKKTEMSRLWKSFFSNLHA